MSNFPKPDELEELLESYAEKLEVYSSKFNPLFQKMSFDLKQRADHLKNRIEKYASYSRDEQLKHLILSNEAEKEIQSVGFEAEALQSKITELDKMYRLGQNLL